MLLWREMDEKAMLTHCERLADTVRQLSPVLIYLSQPDTRQTIQRAAEERHNPDGWRWIDWVIEYIENSAYGKRNRVKGFDGAMEYFELRKALELKALGQLSMPHVIIDNPDYDWDAVWQKIVSYLEGALLQ